MSKGVKYAILAVILVSIAWVFRRGCTRTDQEQAFLDEIQKEGPVQEAFNVKFLFSEMANVSARLLAPHVIEKVVNKENVSYFDRGLRITFFDEEGNIKSDLKSHKGQFYQMFGYGAVWDSVLVKNEEGHVIYTPDTLYYDKKNDRIHSSGSRRNAGKNGSRKKSYVKIETDTDIFYGDSLEANLDFSKYTIYNFSGSAVIKDEN